MKLLNISILFCCLSLNANAQVKLKVIYLSLLLCTIANAAFSQSQHRDSILKVARADARKFRLEDAVWKKYKRNLPSTSDHFKPAKGSNQVSAELITDSIYVQAYREAAFKKNKHRRTTWHKVLVGTGIAAGAYVIMAAAIIIFAGPTMN